MFETLDAAKLQLGLIFLTSFLLSRVVTTTKLPERLVWYLLGQKHLALSRIIFVLLISSSVLSLFIPNVLTVLTLLPVIKLLSKTFEEALPQKYREFETLFPLAIIYGANIGGMGAITGTPANGILVVYATLYKVSGADRLGFVQWLAWGLPVMFGLLALAWAIFFGLFQLWKYQADTVRVHFRADAITHPLQRPAIWLLTLSFAWFITLSAAMHSTPHKTPVLLLTIIAAAVTLWLMFGQPLRGTGAESRCLLKLSDCYSQLPWRGLGLVAVIAVILALGSLANLQHHLIAMFRQIVQQNFSLAVFFLSITALTSLTTEVLSNTVVQLAMFVVVTPMLGVASPQTLPALIAITFACTSAFMTPIATGVNGLAYGEMKGASLLMMLKIGFVMKIFSILLIGYGVPFLFRFLN